MYTHELVLLIAGIQGRQPAGDVSHKPTTTPPQPFYGPFSGTTRVSRCQKRTSGLYGARGDLQRQTHRPFGWAPLHTD